MLLRMKNPIVSVYGPFYISTGVHMYAVGANSRDINKECAKACAMIVNNGGHILNEERSLLPSGYIKVTFTYEIPQQHRTRRF